MRDGVGATCVAKLGEHRLIDLQHFEPAPVLGREGGDLLEALGVPVGGGGGAVTLFGGTLMAIPSKASIGADDTSCVDARPSR